MKQIKILVACGCGVNTSTLVCNEVKRICDREGIPAQILHCSVPEIPINSKMVDIVCPANAYKRDLGKPVLSLVEFVTGINKEKKEKELIEKLKELAEME